MSKADDPRFTTTDGKPPTQDGGAPQPIDPATGQHKAYWILSDEERAKGFTRPVRRSYIHKGIRPTHPLRDLTPEESERYEKYNYVKYETYPEGGSTVGKYWTAADLASGCGTKTTMKLEIAETYAVDPKAYGSTFCCGCSRHHPVGEFVWDGTDEVVGS